MFIHRQPSTVWKVLITCLHGVAIASTSLRLLFRYRRGGIWLDDCVMLPAVLLDVISVVVLWFIYVDEGVEAHSLRTQKSLYWTSSISWLGLIWLTRISLSLSLTRIFPTWGTIRRSSRGISVAFAIFFFGAMSWLWTSSCSRLVDATNQPGTNILDCNSERLGLTIANFVADIVSTSVLIFYQLVILATVPMDRRQNILTITLLVSCIFTLLTSILYCVFSFSPSLTGIGRQFIAGMLSEIETEISVIACNTLAFIVYLWRNNIHSDGVADKIEWRKSHFENPKCNLKEGRFTQAYPPKDGLS